MKLGVYIGSFNPVHIGHMSIVNYLLEKKIVDRVLIVSTVGYLDKTNMVDIKDRINMLKFFETDNILVDDTHNDIPYTYELMRKLKEEFEDELHLIIGADNLEKFHLWKNVDEILKNKVLVLKRNNIDALNFINQFKQKDNFVLVNDIDELNISSTEIRQNQKCRKKYLDKRVLKYIDDNNLYR